jgi:nitroreductase
MEFESIIRNRRSVRDYEARVVEEASILRVIDAAIQAPSASNEQPWTFTVVRDAALLDRLSHEAKVHALSTMPADASSGRYRTMLADPGFQIFYHAPALIVIAASAPGGWVSENCALAAQNLMLAACSLGLGSCWIGFAQRYLNTPAGKQALGIPDSWMPVAPLILGHPRTAPAAVPRKPATIRWVG